MNSKRLLKLADHLDTVPRKVFNMGTWYDVDTDAAPSCQTQACAMGHATNVPAFRRLGLRKEQTYEDCNTKSYDVTMPGCRNGGGMDAAVELFGIKRDDAEVLFSPAYDKAPETPKQVAKRIRRFVANAEANQ